MSLERYPETVSFTGVGRASLKQIHAIALSLVIVGVLFAYLAPPGGYILLGLFILISVGYDIVFIRKSLKPVRVTLYLRENPVEATLDEKPIGEIRSGTVNTDMGNAKEIGFRPAPNRELLVWTFDSPEEARVAARRLLEYLPRDYGP